MSLGGTLRFPWLWLMMSTKRDLCTTWNGSSEGFQDEMQVYKTPRNGEKSGFQLIEICLNGHEVLVGKVSISQAFEQKHPRFFVHYFYFTFPTPMCVFLLFFSSLLPQKFPTGDFFSSSIPGRVAKREAELRPLVIEQHYACGGWLLPQTIPLVARRDGAWTCSRLKTEGRSCWITLKSLQTSGIFMKHG